MKATEFNINSRVGHKDYPDRYFWVKNLNPMLGQVLLEGHFNENCEGPQIQKWKLIADCNPPSGLPKNPNHATQPPLGLMKRRFYDESRIVEIVAAIQRTIHAGYPIFPEWIEEYNEIVARLKAHGDKLY